MWRIGLSFVFLYMQDAVVSFVMAFFIFCAAVALAVYNPQWQDYRQNLADSGAFGALYLGTVDRIIGATGATSVSTRVVY